MPRRAARPSSSVGETAESGEAASRTLSTCRRQSELIRPHPTGKPYAVADEGRRSRSPSGRALDRHLELVRRTHGFTHQPPRSRDTTLRQTPRPFRAKWGRRPLLQPKSRAPAADPRSTREILDVPWTPALAVARPFLHDLPPVECNSAGRRITRRLPRRRPRRGREHRLRAATKCATYLRDVASSVTRPSAKLKSSTRTLQPGGPASSLHARAPNTSASTNSRHPSRSSRRSKSSSAKPVGGLEAASKSSAPKPEPRRVGMW